MIKLALLSLAAVLLTGASAVSAQGLNEGQARTIVAPWYSLFNVASRGDVKAIHEQVLIADYESCSGYLPGECWDRDTSIKVVGNFANSIPDMKFEIKEMLVAGDRVIVRGERSASNVARPLSYSRPHQAGAMSACATSSMRSIG